MDFDFHSPDGEGKSLYFGLSLRRQNIPSIINSVSSISRYCYQEEKELVATQPTQSSRKDSAPTYKNKPHLLPCARHGAKS